MGKLQQETGILNEADALRALIGECEKALVVIDAQNVRLLLTSLAEAHRLLDGLRTSGADVRAEEARLQTVAERMIRNAGQIVAAVGGTQKFIALRRQIAPHLRERWWNLEEEVAAARRQLLRRFAIGAAALVAIGIAGFLLRGVLFPPNPVGDAVFAAQAALREGDVQKAIEAIESGLGVEPASATLLIWKGVLLERQNNPSGSAAALETARSALGEKDYLLEKAQVNLLLGENDRVIADMTYLIETTPDPAEAYYIRATAFENKNELWRAIRDLEAASEIAERIGNDTLFATARVRMGVLMQAAPGAGVAPTATP